MNFNITQNFTRIYRTIGDQGIKRTAFAKAMGYSSTSQLSATLDGEALPTFSPDRDQCLWPKRMRLMS